jgi:hypothetical protein
MLAISSDQPEVLARIQAVNARVAEVEAAAAAYKQSVEVLSVC